MHVHAQNKLDKLKVHIEALDCIKSAPMEIIVPKVMLTVNVDLIEGLDHFIFMFSLFYFLCKLI